MSKLIYFDFQCQACATVFEELVKPDQHRHECKCGGNAERLIATPRIDLLGMAMSESASPASVRKFDRLHQQQRAKEERCFERNGDYGTRPGAD